MPNQVESYVLSYPKHSLKPEDLLTFIEMDGFFYDWQELGYEDEDLDALQVSIMAGPSNIPVIEGTGGLREVNFSAPQKKPIRIRYVFFEEFSIVLLIIAFRGKSELSALERKEVAAQIQDQRDELLRRNTPNERI